MSSEDWDLEVGDVAGFGCWATVVFVTFETFVVLFWVGVGAKAAAGAGDWAGVVAGTATETGLSFYIGVVALLLFYVKFYFFSGTIDGVGASTFGMWIDERFSLSELSLRSFFLNYVMNAFIFSEFSSWEADSFFLQVSFASQSVYSFPRLWIVSYIFEVLELRLYVSHAFLRSASMSPKSVRNWQTWEFNSSWCWLDWTKVWVVVKWTESSCSKNY